MRAMLVVRGARQSLGSSSYTRFPDLTIVWRGYAIVRIMGRGDPSSHRPDPAPPSGSFTEGTAKGSVQGGPG